MYGRYSTAGGGTLKFARIHVLQIKNDSVTENKNILKRKCTVTEVLITRNYVDWLVCKTTIRYFDKTRLVLQSF